MRIVPVLDIQSGHVVRGIGGERHRYEPIRSPLVSSSAPEDVADAIERRFGLREFYLADLDAITGETPSLGVYRRLREAGFRLGVDVGLRSLSAARELAEAGIESVFAALESLPSPAVLRDILSELGPERVVFSLDLLAGRHLGACGSWPESLDVLVDAVLEMGLRRVLVLDLAAVGRDAGPAPCDALGRLRRAQPALELWTGGGVRGIDDLRRLEDAGVDRVLVASALHDGRLVREDIERFDIDP